MTPHTIDWINKRVLVSLRIRYPKNKVVGVIKWLPMSRVLVEHVRKTL